MIVYGNKLSSADVLLINKIAVECGISFDTTRLLFYRNVNTIEKAKEFLNPSKKFFHNPFLFKDMTKVVERIILAKQLNQKVLIFGDYDADGICAVTILNKALQNFGINPIVVVPERADGYGLNLDKILSIHTKEQISLVITVDCGISDKECVKNLKNNGIDVIVTDHHEPPEELPECLIINPKVNGESYPFDGLCGAGVAYKTAYALIGEKANDYLDFTAVATVADSMNLVGENRHIVHEGLKLFSKQNIRLVFKYLIGESDKQVNSQTLAFQIAPRINAGGRMGDANCALKLFISNDQEEIYQNAVKLNSYNLARQVESERVYNEAKSLIKSNNEIINPIICIKGEDWNVGVLGIVSAKLVEEYNRPVIVFAKQDGYYKGSARSIEQVNIHNLITQSSEYLIGFGGHSQAAGLSVEIDKFNDFYKLIISKMNDAYSNVKFTKQIYCDWQIEGEISVEFAREINLLEPFGIGNKKPVFSCNINNVNSQPLRDGSPHYSFNTKYVQMLDFNGADNALLLNLPIEKQVLFELNYSVFRGNESVKGFVKKIFADYSDFSCCDLAIFRNNILTLQQQGSEHLAIDYDKSLIKKGYGTLYVLSDYKNLDKYDNPNLTLSLFNPIDNSGENCIVISPKTISESYQKVIYLDKPLQVLQSACQNYVVEDVCGYDFIDKINVDRQFYAEVFSYLCKKENLIFNFSNFEAEKVIQQFDAYSFIMAVETFIELGIFSINKGLLKRNREVKNALTNSIMYSKILMIK